MTRVGIDMIEIGRIREALERYTGFRDRCFTAAEQAYCDARKNPAQHYAARFAGKEAVGKALGLPFAELERLARLSDGWNAKRVGEEVARLPDGDRKLESKRWRAFA